MPNNDDYIEGLERAVDHWRTQHARAEQRAQYWAKMYDELTAITNERLDDDDEVMADDD
jgi:hypothetical protein